MPNRIEYKKGEILGNSGIIYLEDYYKFSPRRARFKCTCGNTFITEINNVKLGYSTTCGCTRGITNKLSYTKGQILGNFGVVFLKDIPGFTPRKAEFKCECDKIFITTLSHIKRSATKSCGCKGEEAIRKMQASNVIHGLSRHPLKNRHTHMMDRVYNSNHRAYESYKIRLVEPYLQKLENYIEYVEALPNAYGKGLSVDRIDNDLGYIRGNLRWADAFVQNTNKGTPKNNTSGYRGIYLRKENGKYRAKIGVNKDLLNLGEYTTIKEALEARNSFIRANNLEHPIQKFKN